MQIRTVILDFGGVLYDIDHKRTVAAMRELQLQPTFPEISTDSTPDFFHEHECGRMTDTEFRNQLRSTYQLSATDVELDAAWNATLIGLKSDAEYCVQYLCKHVRTVLFSNTNAIHHAHFSPECTGMLSQFAKCNYSFQIGLRKPNADAFTYVLAKSYFKAEETLFVDDSTLNIAAASTLGMQTFHITPEHGIESVFSVI